ncbi:MULTISPECIES: Mini-ribonuclease 3 [unclassified Prochlorococcus]|uniref:Mini-ribonuclease 3 n=1 Tax=unclassified Prochlorococcus TaxID=2627481 RepID=UPI000533B894|nr:MULTISPECIES: ribonuclease III domain-containing protein [unclassified Prochlorococcus]KGG15060.1 hypothetical protein EV06_0924 [Prochlorococcus sp. MIT 0602]KGG17332.1 hypothetical protein EV07_0770 [Prochlorococcus sp. MIT 0603]
MNNWIKNIQISGRPDQLRPSQLAWLGDAVWELHQRLLLCEKPAKTKDLHLSVVSQVKAEAQSKALENIEIYLTDLERKLVRRGRNSITRSSRKVNIAIYGRATGFETLIGWLFLKDPNRLAQLMDLLERIETDKHEGGINEYK